MLEGKLFCEKHNKIIEFSKCDGCGENIESKFFNFYGKKFHEECLKCHDCNQVLDPNNFFIVSNKSFCDPCSLKNLDDDNEEPSDSKSLPRVVALYNYVAKNKDELTFKKGDVIVFVKDSLDKGWSVGFLENDPNSFLGIYPSNYVKNK